MNTVIRKRNGFAWAVGLVAVIAVGVGISSHFGGTPIPTHEVVSLSIAKEYRTLAELGRDADVVALVSVEGTPKPSTRIANVPTVDVQLRVERVLASKVQVGEAIHLIQFGDPTGRITITEPLPPILSVGKRYVVYLNRQFSDQPQMFLTGVAGVFEANANGGFQRLGNASPDLPKNGSLDQF
jgi:hypothetical protein